MREKTIVTLTGPSLSGKSTLQNDIVRKLGLNPIVSHTTRPPREGEKNGWDYYFVSEQEFNDIPMAESAEYAGFRYGISKENIKVNLPAVVTIENEGLKQLIEMSLSEGGFSIMPIYVDVLKDEMLKRWIERATKDGVEHFEANVKRLQFNLKDYDNTGWSLMLNDWRPIVSKIANRHVITFYNKKIEVYVMRRIANELETRGVISMSTVDSLYPSH